MTTKRSRTCCRSSTNRRRTMKFFVCLLISFSAFAQNFQHITVKEVEASGGVANAIARLPRTEPVWAAWTAPTRGRAIYCDHCTLDGHHGNFTISDDDEMPFMTKMLVVARLDNGKVRRVHFYNATCPIEGN